MATTAITPTALTLNTATSDTDDAAGTVATTPGDGWAITISGPAERYLLKFVADGSGDTVVITAGDSPPAILAGLGNLSITLAASDVKYIVVEGARFMQNNGTIVATCGDTGTKCYAWKMPLGGGGGGS
jgi:hypothetical protein